MLSSTQCSYNSRNLREPAKTNLKFLLKISTKTMPLKISTKTYESGVNWRVGISWDTETHYTVIVIF